MPRTARDTVYETLRARLTSGFYPDDVSLVPLAISEEFEVSRTPVREALGLLERDGLLVPTTRGFAIRHRSDEEVLDVFEARAVLESAAAFAAATRRSPLDLARMEENLQRARGSSDPAEVRQAFNAFHDCLRHAAHNETFLSLLRTLEAQVKLSAPWKTPLADHTFDASHREHDAILAAVRGGDAEGARVLMLEHLAHDRDVRIAQLVAQLAHPPVV